MVNAAEPASFSIPELDHVTIDGKADDWKDGGFQVKLMTPVGKEKKTPSDLSADFRLAWNPEGLLVLIRVTDNQFLENHDAPYDQDSIEVFLCGDKDRQGLCQWIITPGMVKGHLAPVAKFYDLRTGAMQKNPAEIKIERQKLSDHEYVMEMLLPWSTLGITAEKGRDVWFQIWVNDCDNVEEKVTHHLAFYPELEPHKARNRLYGLRLDDKAAPTVELTAKPEYDLKESAIRILVSGVAALDGKSVQVLNHGKPVAEGQLKADETGNASATIALPLPAEGENYNNFEVRAEDRACTVSLPMAGVFQAIRKFTAQRKELTEKYGLDRQLDDMKDAPELIQRHRGVVALFFNIIDGKLRVVDEKKFAELAYLTGILESLEKGEDALKGKRGEFWSAYYSPADGSGQHFVTKVPNDYNPNETYPLLVNLHGYTGRPVPFFDKFSEHYIEVMPWGRGDTGYTGLGDNDVMQVIEYMRKWYSIDPQKICLTGYSMGGRGTWVTATRHPDLFAAAAPFYGWADELYLENLRNVPVFNQHGQVDWVVSIDQSRFAVDQLEKLGYQVAHKEFPDAGHGITDPYPVADWMMSHLRPEKPSAVTYSCQTPDRGKAYWLSILKFEEPHRLATATAAFSGFGPQQLLTVRRSNIEVLAVDLKSAPVDRANNLLVQVGTEQLTCQAPLPETLYITNEAGKASLSSSWTPERTDIRPYRAGAAADLYNGEPLLIVYGTGGDDERDNLLEKAANLLSTHCSWHGIEMALGQFPVKADKDVTEQDIRQNNLILLGTPAENSLAARIESGLPLKINAEQELLVEGRKPLSLKESGICLACYNPLAPQRMIFWIAPFGSPENSREWLKKATELMTGTTGENRIDAPDLTVWDLKGYKRRDMQFTHGWKWRNLPGSDRLMPEKYASMEHMLKAYLQAMRENAGADYAFIRAGKEGEKAYDPACYTVADFSTRQRDAEQLTATLTGKELIEISNWVKANEVSVYPEYTPEKIDPEKIYSIVIEPNFCWKLKTRKRNLDNVRAGRPLRMSDFRNLLLSQDGKE